MLSEMSEIKNKKKVLINIEIKITIIIRRHNITTAIK